MKTFVVDNLKWTREFSFCCEWFTLGHLELFTIKLNRYNGHICLLNFCLYWDAFGTNMTKEEVKFHNYKPEFTFNNLWNQKIADKQFQLFSIWCPKDSKILTITLFNFQLAWE